MSIRDEARTLLNQLKQADLLGEKHYICIELATVINNKKSSDWAIVWAFNKASNDLRHLLSKDPNNTAIKTANEQISKFLEPHKCILLPTQVKQNEQASLLRLPKEILALILQYLDLTDLIVLSNVCHTLCAITYNFDLLNQLGYTRLSVTCWVVGQNIDISGFYTEGSSQICTIPSTSYLGEKPISLEEINYSFSNGIMCFSDKQSAKDYSIKKAKHFSLYGEKGNTSHVAAIGEARVNNTIAPFQISKISPFFCNNKINNLQNMELTVSNQYIEYKIPIADNKNHCTLV